MIFHPRDWGSIPSPFCKSWKSEFWLVLEKAVQYVIVNLIYNLVEPHIVIDPAKAFCQRMKFIVRMKKRMKEFKTKKDSMENQKKQLSRS